MSKNASWSYTATATHWKRLDSNENSKAVFDTPVTFKCSYVTGGDSVRDDKGVEFAPAFTLYTEKADIKRGDMVILGDYVSFPDPIDAGADIVRAVTVFDESLFNDIPDYRIVGSRG